MKKSRAEQYFNSLYDATFDDAIAFIAGKTGDTEIADAVLYDTYRELYGFLLKEKEYDEQKLSRKFFEYLRQSIGKHGRKSEEDAPLDILSSKEKIDALLNTELLLTEKKAADDLLVKKAHSYVLQKSAAERKAFILYFYEGYTAAQISELLGMSEQVIYGHIQRVLSEIQNNFLAKYVPKRGEI